MMINDLIFNFAIMNRFIMHNTSVFSVLQIIEILLWKAFVEFNLDFLHSFLFQVKIEFIFKYLGRRWRVLFFFRNFLLIISIISSPHSFIVLWPYMTSIILIRMSQFLLSWRKSTSFLCIYLRDVLTLCRHVTLLPTTCSRLES